MVGADRETAQGDTMAERERATAEKDRSARAPVEERSTITYRDGGNIVQAILDLQRTAGNQATAPLLQRAPRTTTGTQLPPLPSLPPLKPRVNSPPRRQGPLPELPPGSRLPSSLRVRLVAHASPRWRSAGSPTEADKKNEGLSRARVQSVRGIVDAELRAALGADADIRYDVEYATGAQPESTVTVGSEAMGSRETLEQAKGDRSANDPNLRRVDVFVDRVDRREEHAGVSTAPRQKTVLSERWKIRPEVSVTAGKVVGGGGLTMTLINAETGRLAFVHIKGLALGLFAGLGVSAPASADEIPFFTDKPLGFKDFEGVTVEYNSVGIGLVFVGYEVSTISFVGLGKLAQDIDVGGWNVGAKLSAGYTNLTGHLAFNNSVPNDIYTEHSKPDSVPYTTTEQHGDLHTAFFETAAKDLDPETENQLRAFLAQQAGKFER